MRNKLSRITYNKIEERKIIYGKHINYSILIIKLLSLINLFIPFLFGNANYLFKIKSSFITLKIRGAGNKKVFSSDSKFSLNNYPSEVYINEVKQNEVKSTYEFNQINNFVKLIWNNTIYDSSYMFYGCSEITEIDLSNFNTSQIKYMNSMFRSCPSLISLNLLNCDTSKVENMRDMFYKSKSLISLDLSSFNTSKVNDMEYMFCDCINLEYINMKNFNEIKLSNINGNKYIFGSIPENVVICINENNTKNIIFPLIKKKTCYTIDCSNDWKSIQKKIINSNGSCLSSCGDSDHKYEYNSKCYESCSKGDFIENNINKCKCELEKCLTYSSVSLEFGLCIKCNDNYYIMENDSLNFGDYINCYNEITGYYLDKNNSIFKKCYDTCETCEIKGDNSSHNCIVCKENFFSIKIKNSNFTNCYEECEYYYYFDNEKNYHCTSDLSCPIEYSKLKEDKKECIKIKEPIITTQINIETTLINKIFTTEINRIFATQEIDLMVASTSLIESSTKIEKQKYIIENDILNIINELIKNLTESKEEETKKYDILLNYIESIFTSENFNKSKIDNGEDELFEIEKVLVTFTTIENQKNNINNNLTTIDFDDCELILRQ